MLPKSNILVFIIAIVVCFSATITYAGKKLQIKTGSIAPDFVLKDLSGKKYIFTTNCTTEKPDSCATKTTCCNKNKHNVVGEKSELIYIVFFATWCGRCKKEIPCLNRIYQKYKDKGVELLGINVGERHKKVLRFVKKYKVKYPVLLDSKATVAKNIN